MNMYYQAWLFEVVTFKELKMQTGTQEELQSLNYYGNLGIIGKNWSQTFRVKARRSITMWPRGQKDGKNQTTRSQ
jgi:hypothetical protein